MKKQPAKPFVKWVGGKTQLLPDIDRCLPSGLSRRQGMVYVEPFVGGGAVLFWILQKYPGIERAVINDINPRLMATYKVIKKEPAALIRALQVLQDEYLPLPEDRRKLYYLMQRDRYNTQHLTETETAALFIFLNRTCFNGLYRVNSKGDFNVPHGRYASPCICDAETLWADSRLLQKVDILCGDFGQTTAYASPNAIYYLDPPYKPLGKTSSFNAYAKEGFNDEEQIRLRDFCRQLAASQANFVLSNSDVRSAAAGDSFFDDIYREFVIRRVFAKRAVNANGGGRGKIPELMISNVCQCRI